MMGISDWIALGELAIAVVGIIVGCIGGKELKEANNLKFQIKKLEAKIEKIEINNSQIAKVINNNGLGYKDAKELAEDIVDGKTKDKPNVVISEDEPEKSKDADFWLQPYK